MNNQKTVICSSVTDEHVFVHATACLNVMAPVGIGLSSLMDPSPGQDAGGVVQGEEMICGWPFLHALASCARGRGCAVIKQLQIFTPECLSHVLAGEATLKSQPHVCIYKPMEMCTSCYVNSWICVAFCTGSGAISACSSTLMAKPLCKEQSVQHGTPIPIPR